MKNLVRQITRGIGLASVAMVVSAAAAYPAPASTVNLRATSEASACVPTAAHTGAATLAAAPAPAALQLAAFAPDAVADANLVAPAIERGAAPAIDLGAARAAYVQSATQVLECSPNAIAQFASAKGAASIATADW